MIDRINAIAGIFIGVGMVVCGSSLIYYLINLGILLVGIFVVLIGGLLAVISVIDLLNKLEAK
jgi:hypothetical protein